MFDIWSFTDASVSRNTVSKKKTGVYGFVHFSVNKDDSRLFPVRQSFQLSSNSLDNNLLEIGAIELALYDLNWFDPCKIGIFTDSNYAYDRIFGSKNKAASPKILEHVGYCKHNLKVLKEKGFTVNVYLCKSHVHPVMQESYMFQNNDLDLNKWFYSNITFGNDYIDRYCHDIAISGDVSKLKQYDPNAIIKG